ncbi:hypothetical protein AAFF_G00096420 [Aldrovandia affinis]|uniref:Small monomeric GTPase n=1 Tax=Aldrovandia affinis TaxID=143900 RepID=A0AAD7VXV9_9TELE|nr:hypothetical protein AAFF_G00096420 [Aldrovandia affinis]
MDIHGYVLVYSVTSMKSFEVVQVLHDKLLDMVGKIQVPTVLVGNKKDLHMERRPSRCSRGLFWRWRRLMGMSPQRRRSAQ